MLATHQEKGVDLASSFVEQLERLGEQADLATFNGEALLCQLVASGVRELELKKKILELGVEKLTLANVKATIRTFEAIHTVIRQEAKVGAASRTLSCYHCGDTSHLKPDCKADKDKLYCNHCRIKGSHNTKVCGVKKHEEREKKLAQRG